MPRGKRTQGLELSEELRASTSTGKYVNIQGETTEASICCREAKAAF